MARHAERFAAKVCNDQVLNHYDFAEELMCRLCCVNVVGNSPKLTTCSHLFCGDCLDAHWEACATREAGTECPECKTSLNKNRDVYLVEKNGPGASAFVWRMLSTLRVQCNKPCGNNGPCKWTGDYSSYWAHVQCGVCSAHAEAEDNEDVHPSVGDESGEKLQGMQDLCASIQELVKLKERQGDHALGSAYAGAELPACTSDKPRAAIAAEIDSSKASSIEGMENLCSLVEDLIRLKRNTQDSQQAEVVKRASDNSRSPSSSTRGTRSPTVSIADALDIEEEATSSSGEESVPATRRRNALNLSASIQTSAQSVNVASSVRGAAPPMSAQNGAASYAHAARMQQAAQVVHWQRASIAYASQMQMARYQMAAAAYQAQAARYQQAATSLK